MLYATAAVLEGCSFVNGGSQNTMCGALLKLAEVNTLLLGKWKIQEKLSLKCIPVTVVELYEYCR